MDSNLLSNIARLLSETDNTIVITGAGISTEAGVPDFRGKNGIYQAIGEEQVIHLIHIDTLINDPQTFYTFYRRYFTLPQVMPSKAHQMVAAMEECGLVKGVVTQNVDELHQKAGSRNVLAIHGSRAHYYCQNESCHKHFTADYAENYSEIIPRCDICHSILKPDTVLFGETIKYYDQAWDLVSQAEVLLVIGSSLKVYPLAGFVESYCLGNSKLIILNQGPTALDAQAYYKYEPEHTGDTLEEIFHLALKYQKSE